MGSPERASKREWAKIHMSHTIYSPSRSQCASRSAARQSYLSHFTLALLGWNPFGPSVSLCIMYIEFIIIYTQQSKNKHNNSACWLHIAISPFTQNIWHRYDLLTLSTKIGIFLPISTKQKMKKNYDDNNNYITSISYELTRTNASANERACLYCTNRRCYCVFRSWRAAAWNQVYVYCIYHSFGGKNVFKITYNIICVCSEYRWDWLLLGW